MSAASDRLVAHVAQAVAAAEDMAGTLTDADLRAVLGAAPHATPHGSTAYGTLHSIARNELHRRSGRARSVTYQSAALAA